MRNNNTIHQTHHDNNKVILKSPLFEKVRSYQEFIDCIEYPCFLLLDISGKSFLINKALIAVLTYSSIDEFPGKITKISELFDEHEYHKFIDILRKTDLRKPKSVGEFKMVKRHDSLLKYRLTINYMRISEDSPAWLVSFQPSKNAIPFEIDRSLLNFFNNDKYLDEVLVIMDFQGNILSANRKHFIINFFASIADSRFNLFENIDIAYQATLLNRLEKLKNGDLLPPCQYKLNKENKSAFIEIYSKKILYREKPAIISLIRDITLKKENEKKLLHTIVQTEEKERQRFARDLHDELGPFLSALKLYINELQSETDNLDNRLLLYDYMDEMINEAVDKVKMIASNLTPQNMIDEGLTVSINKLINKITRTGHINIDFNTSGKEHSIETSLVITLYRIILELINNSIKHSNGKTIKINLQYTSKNIRLKYFDDGKGFDLNEKLKQSKGIGLKSILNRIELYQGNLKFTRKKTKGIEYNIVFPANTKSPNPHGKVATNSSS